MRRVVVTGLGAVTPVGNNVHDTWSNLLAGKHGIGPITKFDTTDYKATLAAEVKGFDPLLTMDRSFVRRNDPFCQFAVAASVEAMEDAGLAGKIDPERLGVYFSSGIGGLSSLCDEYSKLKDNGPRRVSPYTITMMMPNDAAGEISIRHGANRPLHGLHFRLCLQHSRAGRGLPRHRPRLCRRHYLRRQRGHYHRDRHCRFCQLHGAGHHH